jgi:hypothetical protein
MRLEGLKTVSNNSYSCCGRYTPALHNK